MPNEQALDEMRRRIQGSLAQAKREQLRDQYGMQGEYLDSQLSPEGQNEWYNYILEFERQFETAPMITVRERLGNPPIQPLAEIPLHALEEAVNNLLDLLAEQGIAVDFLGEWDDLAAYRYLTEELLNEEIQDIHIEDTFIHFTPSTPEYDVVMWVENFVGDIFWQERKYFLPGLAQQPLFDSHGEPVTAVYFQEKIERVWQRLPPIKRVQVDPVTVHVEGEEGLVTAVVTWYDGEQQMQVKSFFRLQPSPYTGWDVVQTSLLDDLGGI